MAERIHRHFKRIGTPCSISNTVIWPQLPLRVFPETLPGIYDGDTCNLFAWFSEPPVGEIQLQIASPDGSKQVLPASVPQPVKEQDQDAVIARMAAALKLREISDEKTGQDLAIKYQLVSKWTNYLAIVVRDKENKADTLPELEKVQQMLAAGWGGMGSVSAKFCLSRGRVDLIPMFSRSSTTTDMPTFLRKSYSSDVVLETKIDYSCAPAPAAAPLQHDSWVWEEDYQDLLKRFMVLLDITITSDTMPTTINLPLLPTGIATVLALLVDEGIDERTVVTIFLHHLAASASGRELSRQAKRVISKAYKELKVDQQIAETVLERLRIELGEADYCELLETVTITGAAEACV
jgi:Ca-activated chloride channel family protein